MKLRVFFAISFIIAACLTPATAAVTVVQGTIGTSLYGIGYIADFNDASVISGPGTIPLNGVVFCIDGATHWQGAGNTHQFTVEQTLDFTVAQGADKALGLMNYVIENYWDTMLTTPAWGPRPGYAMNMILWEITQDYDGTLESLDMLAGVGGLDENTAIYEAAIADLRANHDSIPSSYRSTKYNLQFLVDSDPTYQDLLLISPVPEPSSMALLAIGGLALATRRRAR